MIDKTVLAFLLLLALAAPNGAAAAQQAAASSAPPPRPAATFSTEVVVTAERAADARDTLAVSASVLTANELAQRPATTVADAVQMLPGFVVFFTEGAGLTPSSIARGFFGGGDSEYVKVLVDGIPVGDAESGVFDWRRVPVIAIERVEALRGPASAVYGDTALGGVVQLFTAVPNARAGRLTASAGSFGSGSAGIAFGQPVGNVGVQAIASLNRHGGFRAHSGSREGFASLALLQGAGSRRWSARAMTTYVDRDEPGPLTAAQLAADREQSDAMFQFDGEKTRTAYGAFRYASASGPYAYSVLGHVSARTGDRLRTLLLAPGFGDRAARDIATASVGSSFENSLETRLGALAGHLRFGLDWSRDHLDTTYFAVSDAGTAGAETSALDGRRLQLGTYVTQSVNVGSRVALHGGVRWDGLRDRITDSAGASHDAWSPRVGGVVSLGAGTSAFAQVSSAFKAPTLDQLFDRRPFPDFQGGTFFLSSPLLLPQRGTNLEGGLRQSSARFRWEAVVYVMKMRDEIDFDAATFRYANIGRSTHQGVETDAVVSLGGMTSAGVNYTWTRVIPEREDGLVHQLRNIPRHVLRPHVTLTLPREVTLHARYMQTAGTYVDDANTLRLDNRSTIDVRASKAFSRVTARVDALNLTGDRYEEVGSLLPDLGDGPTPVYFPAPGVTIRASVDLSF